MYLYIIQISLFVWAMMEVMRIPFNGSMRIYDVVYFFYILFFVILSGIRWETGTDWNPYYEYYLIYGDIPEDGFMEPLFTWMNGFNTRHFDYQTQILEIAAISIIPIGWRYNRMSPYPMMTLFIWFSIVFAHIFPVRQTISVSIIVFSWKFIEERSFIRYFIGVFLACMFHYSSIIALPLYFIWNLKLSDRHFLLTIATSILAGFMMQIAIKNIFYYIGGEFFEDKLKFYMEDSSRSFGAGFSSQEVLLRGIINKAAYLVGPLVILKKKRKIDKRLNAIFNIGLYSFVIFSMTTPISVALSRLSVFSDMAQPLLLPYIFSLKLKRVTILLLCLILLLYFAVRFRGVVFNYHDLYIPYKTLYFK